MYTACFHAVVPNQIVAAGRENIKLFKIKNACLPGQSVALNNTARGKFFNKIAFQGPVDKGSGYTYVATSDGLLYIVNTAARTVDKVIQIADGQLAEMKQSRNGSFICTVTVDGLIRLWSSDFANLKSEVKTNTVVSSADVSYDADQIAVMSQQAGTISLLDLGKSSYEVIMRSHLGQVTDAATSRITGKIVTVS